MIKTWEDLRKENAELREALASVVAEVEWFVRRQKNLADLTQLGGEPWSVVLDKDLDIARAILEKTKEEA